MEFGNPLDLVPTLETKRLLLRGHRNDDFRDSAAMWADKQVVAHISGVPFTEEQSWSRLLRYTGHWQHLGFGYWVVASRDDGSFLGEVGFADYRRDTEPSLAGKPEAGWVLKSDAHGKGIATEAITAMFQWADGNLDHEKLRQGTHIAVLTAVASVFLVLAVKAVYLIF